MKIDVKFSVLEEKPVEAFSEAVVIETGGTGRGIPAGGKAGQVLCKVSDKDFDVEWSDIKIPEQYGLITYNQNKTITVT